MKNLYPPALLSETPASRFFPGFFPKFFLLCAGQLLFLTAAFAQTNPQQYRWTGAGTDAHWDTPANWQVEVPANSGTWIAAPAPPGSDDDVSFADARVAMGGHRTVYVEYNRPNLCDDMVWTNASGMTFTGDGAAELQVFGGITLVGVSNLTFTFPGTIRLRDQTNGPNSVDITSAGQQFAGPLIFDGTRTWRLVDAFSAVGGVNHIAVTHLNGHIEALANITLEGDWYTAGNSTSFVTFQPGSTVTVTAPRTIRFAALPLISPPQTPILYF